MMENGLETELHMQQEHVDMGGEEFPSGSYALYNSVLVDGGDQFSVTAVAFDAAQELLWAANGGGHVTAYYGARLDRYSSFQAVDASDVRALAPLPAAVLALSKSALKCNRKTGLCAFNFTSANIQDMQCMVAMGPRSYLLGGAQDSLVVFDVERQRETSVVSTVGQDCVSVRRNDRLLFTGDSSGNIHVRDPKSLASIQKLEAHGGNVADMDASGNKLLSCGFSHRFGTLSRDPYVMVYDIRMMGPLRCLPPLSVPFPPALIRFLPTYSDSRILLASQDGEFLAMEMGEVAGFPTLIQPANLVCALDISASKQCLAFGDLGGYVHVFSDSAEPVFHVQAEPCEFADPIQPMHPISFDDDLAPLSLIPAPFSADGSYLSDWPHHLSSKIYRKPLSLDPVMNAVTRVNGFVAYGPKPIGLLRNQAQYDLSFPMPLRREAASAPSSLHSIIIPPKAGGIVLPTPTTTAAPAHKPHHSHHRHPHHARDSPAKATADPRVPKLYRRLALKRSKLAADDFNYRNYNSTPFSGLDFATANAYVAPLLLALHHHAGLRERVTAHLCLHEFCLACEFAFLGTMLSQAQGGALISPNNFLRALRATKEAASLGVLIGEEESQGGKDLLLNARIIAFARFLLQHILADVERPQKIARRTETSTKSKPADETPKRFLREGEHVLDKSMFCCRTRTRYTCPSCKNVEEELNSPLVTSLSYPFKEKEAVRFTDLVSRSLCGATKVERWCEACERMVEATQSRQLLGTPPTLILALPSTEQRERDFLLLQQKWWPSTRGNPMSPGLESKAKPCRYSAACNRPDCRFSHPKPKTPTSTSAEAAGPSGPVEEAVQPSFWFQPEMSICILDDGKVAVSDVPPSPAQGSQMDYELFGAVYLIRESLPTPTEHLVACVKTTPPEADEGSGRPWTVFNELVVCGVSEEEALEWSYDWKLPVMLLFRAKDTPAHHPSADSAANPIQERVFWEDAQSLAGQPITANFDPLTPDERLPRAGDLVGIDAEFVVLNEEGRSGQMSLARVSCIRGYGDKAGVPFIDDYISNSEEVADYATQFSGIVPGDLDVARTNKHLTTLKSTYVKLRWLADRGVCFVGHGLANDFRVINIFIPAEQIIDTVRLFHQSQQRMVSLRFLSWHFFGKKIQSETHDSIEDARAALDLYDHYLTLQAQGPDVVTAAISALYEKGHELDFKVPPDE